MSNRLQNGNDGARRRVVVVGCGMVSHRFCERLSAYDSAKEHEIVVFCEEPRPAYDRVQLTSYLGGRTAEELLLADPSWYAERQIQLLIGRRAVAIERTRRVVTACSGEEFPYDVLVLATGSRPFVPRLPGIEKTGVFVYRTIEDLDCIAAAAKNVRAAAVLGGGLLGLEAAKAVRDLGLETHVVELAPRLMPRQLDSAGAALLKRSIEALGVHVHVGRRSTAVLGDAQVEALELDGGEQLDVGLVVISAGIVARDELAREAGLAVNERGGVIVDDALRTADSHIYAIGEVAAHDGMTYGLVSPGYAMADVVARNLAAEIAAVAAADSVPAAFAGADTSTKLKLLGVEVASFGDPFADAVSDRSITYGDWVKGVYKKLVVSSDGKHLLGGVLVGDTSEYGSLVQLVKSGEPMPESPERLILGAAAGAPRQSLPDTAQICSCNNVCKKDIVCAIREQNLATLGEVKSCTKAGSGCGGCTGLVNDILTAELKARGQTVRACVCEHFAYTRQELFEIVKIKKIKSFEQLIGSHGTGMGCEVCKPVVASILASLWNEPVLDHGSLQDTNDRFLANLQRGGSYSVVPRIPAGEITPEKLIVLGQVAQKYGLYTKITGGQRIDMFGARVEQLPAIWEELVAAGFESGHAYGKAVRTVKSCVGTSWCRFGVQDSVAFAIRVENRYKGIRAPHKLKSAVSGCTRECAEAQSKDFGLIATEKGWNLYVCGNGGMKPRHADLLASDLDEDTVIKYLDRFIMYYIQTADRLTRTSVWLDKMEGGIDHLREVVVHDRLGICDELERQMAELVRTYRCEWADVVGDPARRARFRQFVGSTDLDLARTRPAVSSQPPAPARSHVHLPVTRSAPLPAAQQRAWTRVARAADVPPDTGACIRWGNTEIALFNFASRGQWHACENRCPHTNAAVLSRGIIGDECGVPKVACPMHKKTFSLEDGQCLSGEGLSIETYPVKVEGGFVYIELPPEPAPRPVQLMSSRNEAKLSASGVR
jgi:nitrite reductase (NADH) large subunit